MDTENNAVHAQIEPVDKPTENGKSPKKQNTNFLNSIVVKLAFLISVLLIIIGLITYLILQYQARPAIVKTTNDLIVEVGNQAVQSVSVELMKINGMATGLSAISDGLPNDYELYEQTYSHAAQSKPLNAIGLGFWFEPFQLDGDFERRALYWWSNSENGGNLELTRDYENPDVIANPYYKDWWYVPTRHAKNHKTCAWSGVYLDPVSNHSMVTCARPINDDVSENMKGVVTVDLDTDFVQQLFAKLQEVTGGYIFLTDNGGRFVSFPDRNLIRTDENRTGFITASDLAITKPDFKPVADLISGQREEFVNTAKGIDSSRFDTIVNSILSETDKLTEQQAEEQAAQVLLTENNFTFNNGESSSGFVKTASLNNDFYLNEPSQAYLFSMPYTYWNLVIVKPESEITSVANVVTGDLIKYFLLALIPLILIGLAALYYLFGRPINSVTDSVQNLTNLVRNRKFEELKDNKLDNVSNSEIGLIGQSMNQLVDTLTDINGQLENEVSERTEAQKKAEAENDKMNNSVIEILQSVQMLSQRDLTVKAPVTDDIIGTVSDSINYLTSETSQVLKEVTDVAGQVKESSTKVQDQASLVSVTAEEERKNVSSMVESLFQATQTMNRVAALAEESNEAAAQATEVTDNALITVNGTVQGMESIRETIAETEKRIKRLGERSQEISGIVNLINTISERTHVLALNASMQAAVAGEAGRGFAVVAEEVQRLAESSRNATQQIASLVGNIQIETNETINTVNNTIAQVVEGSAQAQKAGEQMRQTQQITEQLVGQVRSIAQASDQQKAMSAELLEAVQRMGESTEKTAQQIEAQNAETSSLQQAAKRLVDSVGVFKLPD